MARTKTTWTQSTLLPPEAVEAVLRLGIVGSANHAQLQIEVRDATDGTLLDMWSRPSVPWGELAAAVEDAAQELKRRTRPHVAPF